MDDEQTAAVERAWQQYREAFVPPCLSEGGVLVIRDAFFNGATILFKALCRNETDEEAAHTFELLNAELSRFSADFSQRAMPGPRH